MNSHGNEFSAPLELGDRPGRFRPPTFAALGAAKRRSWTDDGHRRHDETWRAARPLERTRGPHRRVARGVEAGKREGPTIYFPAPDDAS